LVSLDINIFPLSEKNIYSVILEKSQNLTKAHNIG
jgi:hypothetical protein